MTILDRYIGASIIKTTLTVVVVLMGLQLFIGFADELGDVGKGDYGIAEAFIYVVLDLPFRLYRLFPMIGLLGGVIGLGVLASRSELIITQTAGVSILRICGSVLLAAFFMISVVTLLGEVVAPPAKHLAETNKSIQKSGGQALKTQTGLWVRDGNNFINIQQLLPGKRIEGLSRYQFSDKHQLQLASFAKRAYFDNDQWVAVGVEQSRFKHNTVQSSHFDEQVWDIQLSPSVLAVSDAGAEEMSINKLYRYVHYLKENGLEYEAFDLTFWRRLFQPIETGVMILLAIPFVFGQLRKVTMGLRVTMGVCVGFAFYILNQFFGPLSLVYRMPAMLGALLPLILFSLVALILIRRVRA